MAGAPLAGLTVDVLLQVSWCRFVRRSGLLRSIIVGFAGGLLVTGFLCVWCTFQLELTPVDTAGQLLANLATFMALGYGYFHFLNLGETARRVRLLRELVEADGSLSPKELYRRYNAQTMVRARLDRLIKAGQVILQDGRYCLGNSTLLFSARIIEIMKLVVLGKRSEFDP
jgi:hypothetical protein